MDRMGWFQMNYQKQMVDYFFFFFFTSHMKRYTQNVYTQPPKKVTGDLTGKTL